MIKIFLTLMILCLPLFYSAQEPDDQSAGIGCGGTMTFNSRTPGMAVTPYGFFKFSKSEIFMGVDIYPGTGYGTVLGFQCGYNYTFYEISKSFNLFGNVNIQYTQFANGEGPVVPFKYLPTDSAKGRVNLVQTKSFINTFGVGANLKIVKKLGMQIMVGCGYNSYTSNYSPTNVDQIKIYQFDTGSKVKFIGYAKINLTYRIWKNTKKAIE